ncbi:glycosyltransferase [Pseudochelatococcus contaminans]|uniref:Glycosyltransferase involved in cell wall biosynthesis n=1 Tax=Pseudochelatococcus contaminans TaxID=1538103 RepID=A0A7W6EF36_9HYPH|nr:glycosyltransferase [Pseudochelatococcus contaminans]MBB3808505.1 glycosyltransferase involved in cell wall biosynthesis [Pseudochelatococcus contaminans]
MKIAVIAHIRHPIAPPFMGGMEAHAFHLVKALAQRGHAVTLFASGDSQAAARIPGVTLRPVIETHYDRDYPWQDYIGSEVLNELQDKAFAALGRELLDGDFDVVHNNALHRYPPRLARAYRLPMVTSLHVPPFDALLRSVRESAAPWSRFTVTSHRQRDVWWPDMPSPHAAVVYNGIDLAAWPFNASAGADGAVWAGRLTPTKGAELAIRAAQIAGIPLTLFGAVEDRHYFDTVLRPLFCGDIRYGGHVSGAELATAFGRASVMLFTPRWEEPFGLAAVEAMACGLPVAATAMGAVPEVIGKAGCLAPLDDAEALAAAMLAAKNIDRRVVRARVERLFGIDSMIDGYEVEYRTAIASVHHDEPPVSFPEIELRVDPAFQRSAA